MLHLVDVSRWQVERSDPLDLAQAQASGYTIANVALTGGRGYVSGGWAKTYLDRAEHLGMGRATYHWLDGRTSGAEQAAAQLARMRDMLGSGLGGFAHFVDVEESGTHGIAPPTWEHARTYVDALQQAVGRHIGIYSADYWWRPRGWDGASLTPYLMGPPNEPIMDPPATDSPAWMAGWGGWPSYSVLQWSVRPLPGTGACSLSAIRDHVVWPALTGTEMHGMAMNPRTHPRGAPPSFALPRPNPNPGVMTDALWWLVCMRELLEPDLSGNGGTYANKSGSHNIGANLPDYGEGDPRTDHSIRHAWNRTGPWWRSKTAAHDWTFWDAQRGDYRTINKYTRRQIAAMSDPNDLRTDRAVFYVLGNVDGDVTTEGYNEIDNDPETSGDNTHAWHIHDSFFRDAVGSFAAMWRVLTVDMGWTYAEWQRSVAIEEDDVALTVADIKLLATTQIWPAPPTSGIAGPLSLQDLLSRTYIRSMEGRNFASNINAALAAYIAAEATDDRAKTAALAELRKTIGDAQVAEASRDTQNMTDLFTRIAELASASGGVTADMLLTALREIYGEAFTRAVEANADRLPRNVVTRATDAGELPEASES